MVKHISEKEFEVEVLKEEGIVIVDFFATWCGPCKMLAPILEEVQVEMKDVKVLKIDINENPNLASEYEVKNIPTIKIFKNGEDVKTKIGFLPKETIVNMIEELVQ